jgi:hypothetical protein
MSRADRNRLLTSSRIAEAVIATIKGRPQGSSADRIWAVCEQYQSLSEYRQMMGALLFAGRIRRRGECYYPASTS